MALGAAAHAGSLPLDALPQEQDARAGFVDQQLEPAIAHAHQVAIARQAALQAALSGERHPSTALPELDDDAMSSASALRARLAGLDAQGIERVNELASIQALPQLIEPVEALHAAQASAAAAERTLLYRLLDFTKSRPSWSPDARAQARANLDQAIERAERRSESDDPSTSEAAHQTLAELLVARARWALILHMGLAQATHAGAPSPSLEPELTALQSDLPVVVADARERLAHLMPLLPNADPRREQLTQALISSAPAQHAEQPTAPADASAEPLPKGNAEADAITAMSEGWATRAQQILDTTQQELNASATAREERLQGLIDRTGALHLAWKNSAVVPEGDAADAVYAELRAIMTQMRDQVLAPQRAPEHVFSTLDALPPSSDRRATLRTLRSEGDDGAVASIERAEQAIDAEDALLSKADELLTNNATEELKDLRRAAEARHRLQSVVSRGALNVDVAELIPDVIADTQLLQHQARGIVSERLASLLSVPSTMLNYNALSSFLWRMLGGFVVLGVFLVARHRTQSIAQGTLRRLQRWGLMLPPGTRSEVLAQLQNVAGPFMRAVALFLLAPWIEDISPEIGLLVRGWAWVATFQALTQILHLLATRPDERRPSLAVLTDEGMALVDSSLRAFAGWFIVGWVLQRALTDLVFADALASVVGTLVNVVGLVLLVVHLSRWDTRLLARVRRMRGVPAWVGALLRRERLGPLRPLRALAMLLYLSAAMAWDLLQRQAAERSALSAVASVMDRVRFGGEAEDGPSDPLDESTIEALTTRDVPASALVVREAAQSTILEQVDDWKQTRKQGVLVLTGDRGDGKRVLLEQLEEQLTVDNSPAVTHHVGARITTKKQAIAWVAVACGIKPVPDSADSLVEALNELPAQVHIVRATQRTFLRKVGGFDALRALLYIFNAASDKHFWVLGFHRLSWSYLSRIGSLLNVGVVRAVVDLSPMNGDELSELVLARTRAVGLEVSFARLENTGPFVAPPKVERERAIRSYFRVLADASGGCPSVALRLWARSLRPTSQNKADVVIIPDLATRGIGNLAADKLFVLAALRTQDLLSIKELCTVLHANEEDVRANVRELTQQGLLHVTVKGARIDDMSIRPATLTLRRRHFLQWEV